MARPRKPAALKLVDGNTRKLGKAAWEAEIAAEPVARRGFPECPKHLRGNARLGWKTLTEELAAMGLDARVDSMAVQAAAELYGRAVDADIVLSEQGITVEVPVTVKGVLLGYVTKARPEEAISRRSWTLFRQYAADLAATVISRSRLSMPKSAGKSVESIDDAIFGS
jgi:P27 family predicted phage terminase small subunit